MSGAIRPVSVVVEALDYHYPDGMEALSGVRFAAGAGERVGLIGPNGAGKSTLLLHLAALLPERRRYVHRHGPGDAPHRHDPSFHVSVDGVVASPATERAIRERVGIVFSDPDDQLIGLTVAEEVGYGPLARGWPRREVDAVIAECLAEVGLAGFEARSPHHLSAGEKRRVCIAAVLACRPGLLLLDEPSSGLDPRGRRELGDLLRQLPATQVVAAHDHEFVRRVCTRSVILDRGAVVAEGETERLLSDRALLARHGLE